MWQKIKNFWSELWIKAKSGAKKIVVFIAAISTGTVVYIGIGKSNEWQIGIRNETAVTAVLDLGQDSATTVIDTFYFYDDKDVELLKDGKHDTRDMLKSEIANNKTILFLDSVMKVDTALFHCYLDSTIREWKKHPVTIEKKENCLIANSFAQIETLEVDTSTDKFKVIWENNEWFITPVEENIQWDTLAGYKACPAKYLKWAKMQEGLIIDDSIIDLCNAIGNEIILTTYEGRYSKKHEARLKIKGMVDSKGKFAKAFSKIIDPIYYKRDGIYKAVIFKGYSLDPVYLSNYVYRSVGANKTTYVDTSNGTNLMSISVNTATFNSGLADSVGVGDVIVYDTSGASSQDPDTFAVIWKRNSATSFTIKADIGGSPVEVTDCQSWAIYRAHTSLFNAEAGTKNTGIPGTNVVSGGNRNLITNNEIWNIACYADSIDTLPVVWDGWTTQDTDFVMIYTPVADTEVGASQRHDGIFGADGYQLRVISNNYPIDFRNNHLKIDGLQIEINNDKSAITALNSPDNSFLWVSNCILISTAVSSSYDAGITIQGTTSMLFKTLYAWNNIIYGFNQASSQHGIAIDGSNVVGYLYNNTIINCVDGVYADTATMYANNNICFKVTDAWNLKGNGETVSGGSNAYSEGADPDSNGILLDVKDSLIIFKDWNNKNYLIHLSDTCVTDSGVDLSLDAIVSFNTDIIGETRPQGNAWDIGACEAPDHLIWSSIGNQNWSVASNWNYNVVPTAMDSVVFNNTSVVNCTLSTASNCKALVFESGYSGTFNQNSQDLTVSGSFSWSGTGTLALAGNFTQDADGNFTINNAGSVSLTACVFDYQGSGTITISKTSMHLYSIKLAYIDKIVVWSATTGCGQYYSGGQMEIGAGTLTLNNPLNVYCYNVQANPIIVNASATINGTSQLRFATPGTSTFSVNIPAMTLSGSTTLSFDSEAGHSTGTWTVNLTGNISAPANITVLCRYGGELTFNTNNYSVTTASNLNFGTLNAGSDLTFNCGSSAFDVGGIGNSYNTAGSASQINLGTSTWTIKGDVTLPSNVAVDAGTSQWTFTTNNSNFTSSGKTLYDIIFNQATKTYTLLDALACNSLTVSAGNFTMNGQTITSASTVSFNNASGGTNTIDANITITGNGNFNVAATAGATTGGGNVILQGTGNLNLNRTCTINIDCAYPSKTTTSICNFPANAGLIGTLTLNGGTFTHSTVWYFDITTQTTPLILAAPSTINGTGANWYFNAVASSPITITIPALTYTGSAAWWFRRYYSAGLIQNITYELGGDINLGANTLNIQNRIVGGTYTFNTQNYAITCGDLKIGNFSTGSTGTWNFGSSTLTVNSFENTTWNQTTCSVNMGTSLWICKGNWAYGSNSTVNPGTSQITFNTNNANITSNGKSFYGVKINGSITVTPQDAFSCNDSLYVLSGTLNPNGKSIVVGSTFKCGTGGNITAAGLNACSLAVGGDFYVEGQLGDLLTMNASAGWKLKVDGNGTAIYTNVSYSDASSGNQIDASANCTNSGNNINWVFSATYDTSYRDTALTASTCLSLDSLQTFYADSQQVDSIFGVDTLPNWLINFRDSIYIDTTLPIIDTMLGDTSTLDTITWDRDTADSYGDTAGVDTVTRVRINGDTTFVDSISRIESRVCSVAIDSNHIRSVYDSIQLTISACIGNDTTAKDSFAVDTIILVGDTLIDTVNTLCAPYLYDSTVYATDTAIVTILQSGKNSFRNKTFDYENGDPSFRQPAFRKSGGDDSDIWGEQ